MFSRRTVSHNIIINRQRSFSKRRLSISYNKNNIYYYYYYYQHVNDSAGLHPSTAILTIVKDAEGNAAPRAIM